MNAVCRTTAIVAVMACVSGLAAAQPSAPPASPRLTLAEMETFLRTARIIRRRDAGDGVTGSRRVTLSDGRLTHDAHLQTVDESATVFQSSRKTELNFKDSYRYNIAAYRLAQAVGLTTVPMSVRRFIDGKTAAITWWLDDVLMNERQRLKAGSSSPDPRRTANQLQVMRVFDELIRNHDRNQGNLVWTTDWTLWLIDHTRAFRLHDTLLNPRTLVRCERGLLEGLKGLTQASLAQAVGDSLNEAEQRAVLIRRDQIVKLYQHRIATLGEAAVLFTF
jgi:hypothetical protein